MSTGKPFFFDQNIFDSDDPRVYEEQKPEKPEFTASDLKAAKAQAFEEGKRAGIQENEASLTQSVLGLLQKVDRDMAVLHAAEQDRIQRFETECLHLTYSITSKLFPVMDQAHGQDELKDAIMKAIKSQSDIEALRLDVHGDLIVPIKGLLQQSDTGKNIALTPNSALGLHEFKMAWPDGGLLVNRLEIVDEILGLMKETLAERGVTVHDEEVQDDAPAPEGEPEK